MARRATITEMIDAIRADSVVGCGTCSTIDEAFTESEMIAFLAENGCRSVSGAIKAARAFEKLHAEYDCGLSPNERDENSRPSDASDDYLYRPHHDFDADFEGHDDLERHAAFQAKQHDYAVKHGYATDNVPF